MSKTEQTYLLENALYERSAKNREYGCAEVTIGFKKDGHGDEIVDFMSMDFNDVVRCFEIKVSLADLKTDNKKSWYGDYNYLVISKELSYRSIDYDDFIPPYVGILVGNGLEVLRKAKQYKVKDRDMLKTSLLRSVYWKMLQYKESSDLDKYKDLLSQLEQVQNDFASYKQEVDRQQWTLQDFSHYYALNHQLSTFSIDQQAKEERKQYFKRQKGEFTWIKQDGYVCPYCNYKQNTKTNYCPQCGSDLRVL